MESELLITGRTVWKLGYQNGQNEGKPISDKIYLVKGNASGVIDEIVQTSKFLKKKPLLKERKGDFAKEGFEYRTAYFRDLDGGYYKLTLSVGLNENSKEVYNIGKIEKALFPVSGSKAKTGTIPYSHNITQGKKAVNSSIPKSGEKYSANKNDFAEGYEYDALDIDGIRYSVNKNYEDQVDDVLNNTHDKNNHVYMGNTPVRLMDILGLKRLPMLITSNHVYSMSVSEKKAKLEGRYQKGVNYHDLGDIVKKLPELLNCPLMIIKSKTSDSDISVVVITDAVDKQGSPVMAAIKPYGKGFYYGVEFDTNILLSSYGKDNYLSYLQKARNEGRILYINKKSNQHGNIPGVQFPNNVINTDYSNSLARYKNLVNRKTVNNSIFKNAESMNKKSVNADKSSLPARGEIQEIVTTKDTELLKDSADLDLTPAQQREVNLYKETAAYVEKLKKRLADAEQTKAKAEKQKARIEAQENINKIEKELVEMTDLLDQRRGAAGVQAALSQAVDVKLSALIEKYGSFKPGYKPIREVVVPQKTAENRRVRRTVRTILESGAITDEMVPDIKRKIAEGEFSYNPVSDKASLSWAESYLKKHGYDGGMETWDSVVNGGIRATKNHIALAEYLLQTAARDGNVKAVLKLSAEIASQGTSAGQTVQAISMMKKLNDFSAQKVGELYYVQKSVEEINRNLEKRFPKKKPTVSIDEKYRF